MYGYHDDRGETDYATGGGRRGGGGGGRARYEPYGGGRPGGRGGGGGGGGGTRVFVHNLPWSLAWQEVKDVFRQARACCSCAPAAPPPGTRTRA